MKKSYGNELYARQNYVLDIKFVRSVNITEYDIRQANINILRQLNRITDAEYRQLSILPKQAREVVIGKMIRNDNTLYEALKDGIIEAKRNLFEYNNIQNHEVIRIANDAVYIMRNAPLQYTQFGIVEFIPKHRYSMMFRSMNLIFLYSNIMGEIDLDVIGLGADQLPLHEEYMLSFIGNLLYLIDSSDITTAISYFNNFYSDYLNYNLPIDYYRELNSDSLFKIKAPEDIRTYGISEAHDPKMLEIGFNAKILRDLYGVLVEVYNSQT